MHSDTKNSYSFVEVVFLLANMTSPSGDAGSNGPPRPVAKPKRFLKTPYGDGEIIEETFTEMTRINFLKRKLFRSF